MGTVLDMVGGGNNFGSCDLSCDKLKGHRFFFVDLIKDCFHWHVHLNAIVNPVCVILYSIV